MDGFTRAGYCGEAQRVFSAGAIFYRAWSGRIAGKIASDAAIGDIVLVLGAGNINKIGTTILENLQSKN